MYELIIFTMMLPHVEPKWQHLEPTSEIVCIEQGRKFEKLFAQTKELVFSFTCEPVKKEEEDT